MNDLDDPREYYSSSKGESVADLFTKIIMFLVPLAIIIIGFIVILNYFLKNNWTEFFYILRDFGEWFFFIKP